MKKIKSRPKSRRIFEQAKLTLAGGVGSSSRVYPEPLILERAKGSRVFDIDGNEYIDLLCAYGPIILGHANEAVNEAVVAQIARGICQYLRLHRTPFLKTLTVHANILN